MEEVTVMMTVPVSKIKYTICPLTSILTMGCYRPISVEPGSFQPESVPHVVAKASNRDFCFIVATVQALFFPLVLVSTSWVIHSSSVLLPCSGAH